MFSKFSNFAGPISSFSKFYEAIPILYIDAGLNSSFTIGNNVINDISNHNNNLNLYGGVTFSTDFQGSLVFNGVDGYLYEETFNNPPESQLTILVWIKPNFYNSYICSMGRHSEPGGSNREGILQLNSEGTITFWDYLGYYGFPDPIWSTASNYSNTIVGTSSWSQVVFVKNGLNGKYYLNGELDGAFTASIDVAYSSETFTVGSNLRDGDLFFDGNIGTLKVYNKALTALEIRNNYLNNHHRYNAKKASYIKMTITAIKNLGDSDNCTQMADLVLKYNGSIVAWDVLASATNPDGYFNPGEGSGNLLDNNSNTKWCDINFVSNSQIATIYINNNSPITFDSYYYVTANDVAGRDPVSWTLEISNDNSNWILIDTQTNVSITDVRKTATQVFTIN